MPKDSDVDYDDEIVVKKTSSNRDPAPVVNVDDIPVGNQGKKLANFSSSSYDEHDGADLSEDRPIRPKAQTDYNDRDPIVDQGDDSSMGTGMPSESFPVGEHPLEGVPGCLDLPTPELLSIKSKEYCDQHGIIKLVGEYRARCLFSKSWNLRDAMLIKTQNLLKTEFSSEMVSSIAGLGAILKVGIEDKMQQVMASSTRLLELTLNAAKRYFNCYFSVFFPFVLLFLLVVKYQSHQLFKQLIQ
jgi:hypothetical protein